MCPGFDQAILLFGIYPRKIITVVQRYMCKGYIFITTLFYNRKKKERKKHWKAQEKGIGPLKPGTSTQGHIMQQNDLGVYLLARKTFAYIAK